MASDHDQSVEPVRQSARRPVALGCMGTRRPPGKGISAGHTYSDIYWQEQLAKVKAFHTVHDRWPDRASGSPVERRLAGWLSNQRIMWQAGCLPASRRKALVVSGVWLEPDGRDARWVAHLAELQAFHTAHQRWPSASSDDPAARRLAKWLNKQQTTWRAGRMPKQRQQALVAAGIRFDRSRERKNDDHWAKQLARLKRFRDAHKRWPVKTSSNLEEHRLWVWLANQHSAYRAGKLSGPRQQALLDAGVNLAPQPGHRDHEDHWAARLAALNAFHAANSRWPTVSSADPGERSLGGWLANQRMAYRAGKLSAPHQQALSDALTPSRGRERHEKYWLEQLAKVVAFHATHNRWPALAAENLVELKLSHWLDHQRVVSRAGRMSEQHRQALLDAGIDLTPGWGQAEQENRWADQLADLEAFHAANGRWPSRTSDDPEEHRLAVWLSNQKIVCRAGKMTPQRQQALHAAGFDFAG